MSSSFGEALFNFDLNFLQPTSNNTVTQSKLDKQRRAILIVKKKIIATDSLIKKYFTKKDELELSEKKLFASKEECKQICLDYRKSLDSCSVLENDMLVLQNTNKELVEKCFQVENQLGASRSHTHQLQILVKEYETLIESLKIENKLAKSNAKDFEKKLSSVQKENKTIIRHIKLAKNIIFGKKKLGNGHKIILQKYDKYKSENSGDDAVFGTVSSEEDDFEDSPLSPFYEDEDTINEINCDQGLKSPDTTTELKPPNTAYISRTKSNINQDIEYSNDLGSMDTGRGSSLGLSDNDKCSHSTDYFINDSPLSDISIANTHATKLIDTATSPVPACNVVHSATSPIEFEKFRSGYRDIGQNTDNCDYNLPDLFSSKESTGVITVDHAVSPILLCKTIERAVSPISNVYTDIAISPIQFQIEDQNDIHQDEETQQLKECLELNCSNNVCQENDSEIQIILSKMRMDLVPITPIPVTPVKSRHANKMGTCNSIKHLSSFNCPDAALAMEDNKKLESRFSKIEKELLSIKSMLKIQFSSVHQNEDTLNNEDSMLNNEDIYNNDHFIENNELHISHPIVFKTPTLEHSNDYEPSYTLISQEIPITDDENELQVLDSNSLLQTPNRLNPILSPDIENENDFNEIDTIGESDDNYSNKCLQNEEEIKTPSNFEVRSPIVRCEKLDLNSVCKEVNNTEKENQPEHNSRKMGKVRKLTKLSKLKRRILPKYKIRQDYLRSSKRSHVKQRKIVLPINKKIVTEQDSAVTLNDKTIYQKAIKVMAALKLKEKSETSQNNHAILRNKKKENIDINNTESNVAKTDRSKSVDKQDDLNTEKNELCSESSPLLKKSITTRSRSKFNSTENNTDTVTDNDMDQDNIALSELYKKKDEMSPDKPIMQETRKRLRSSGDSLEVPSKRLLRSSVNQNQVNTAEKITANKDTFLNVDNNNTEVNSISSKNTFMPNEVKNKDTLKRCNVSRKTSTTQETGNINNTIILPEREKQDSNSIPDSNPKQSILCIMIEKYGVQSVKYCVNKFSETVIDSIAKRIEEEIVKIIELPYNETKDAMNKLVEVIETWNVKHFISGLMKYLKDPARKLELYKTLELPPAPPMTKPEQVLLYIVAQFNSSWPEMNIVDKILSSIEYTLFALNRTPHFEVIESMSHFYAVICRYFKFKSRLRLFMLDAMYCIQHKSVTLIKQCLDVWMHILPLAHMGIAKNPLVTCLVYLLHFYKCEDKYNKVRDMRIMLSRNYFYKITDWNEAHILDMFRNSIKEIKSTKRGNLIEKKMLRIALIILAKRQGTKWCQNNIIKKLLQPIIENDKTQDSVKEFCVSLLGPLMKPYPIDMKVHCEVVMNQLFTMLQNNPSPNMTEAIMSSLIYMNRHNHHRVIEAMISWKPHEVSYEFEEILRGFVRSKPIKAWKTTLARIPL